MYGEIRECEIRDQCCVIGVIVHGDRLTEQMFLLSRGMGRLSRCKLRIADGKLQGAEAPCLVSGAVGCQGVINGK